MALKIGELAKRTGLTVRTLHHYHDIGLLKPSARSDAGYRLYSQADVARLHRIQALRKFGLALSDIGAYLTRPDLPVDAIVGKQIEMLTQQIEQADALRTRLSRLRQRLLDGQEPDLADWLTTLEQMTMYDKYFSQDELAQLPLYAKPELKDEWRELVAVVTQVMADGALPSDRRSQELARTWMKRIVRDTAGNPVLFAKLNAMHENEAEVQAETGVTRALMDFILAAKRESALAIYRQYLTDEEYAFVRANLGKRDAEWPQLIARVRTAMDDGLAPGSPEVQALARHWFDLFRSFAGDNPATQAKIRQALMTEPALTEDGWVDAAMRDFIRAAMEAMRQAPRA